MMRARAAVLGGMLFGVSACLAEAGNLVDLGTGLPVAQTEADLLRQMRGGGQGTGATAAPGPAEASLFSAAHAGPPRGSPPSVQAFEPAAEAAAFQHGIGTAFFKRLIRQESGYNPWAVSRAGAQGIAQFMPGTAAMMGLDDPFDPSKALPKAAELLAMLHRRLGNEGLAAAAYNAGEGRIRAWLAGQGSLPLETQHYVRAITGRDAQDWAPPGTTPLLSATPLFARATGLRPIFGRISPEWSFALSILPKSASNLASVAQPAALPGRKGAKPSRTASAPRGEAALCASLSGRGCIMAAVY